MKRMEETEKLVKKKIYILDAFPAVVWGTVGAVNNKLKSGVTINDVWLLRPVENLSSG